MEFDIEVDEKTGKTVMKPKVNTVDGQKVEVFTDPNTGEQSIRFIPQKHVEKSNELETIYRSQLCLLIDYNLI